MKKQFLAVAALLFLASLVPTQSHAQYATKANVPFVFQAGSTVMPAGEYEIRRVPLGAGVEQIITRTDSSGGMFLVTDFAESGDRYGKPRLTFHCYNHDCFLSEVWAGNGQGWKLMESRREKELSRASAENILALVSVPLTVKP
jgi:hypothetical protein